MKLQCELDHKTQEVAKLQAELETVKSDKSGLKQKVYELSAEIARLKKILEMDNGLRARWLFDDCERYRAEIERLNKELNEALNRDPFL
jgi:chromosome segregation ATPase